MMVQSARSGSGSLTIRGLLTWAAVAILHAFVVLLARRTEYFNSFFTPLGLSPASQSITSSSLLSAVRARRSHYALDKNLTLPNDKIVNIVEEAIQEVPSAFNSQSNRAVVLFNAEHDKLWDVVADTLKVIVSEYQWEATKEKLAGFKAAAGTVLFFEDQDVVDGLIKKFPACADKFPVWSTQSDGMLQLTIWTALEIEGLGANLQHYNPLIDTKVAKAWDIPPSWRLNAQLVFGGRASEPGKKTYKPIEEKLKVFGS